MGSFSIWHWLIVLVVVVLVFGTRKLGSAGKDLGAAVKGFKEGMKGSGDTPPATPAEKEVSGGRIIDHDAGKDKR